jgi:hypothetical protein
MNLMTSSTWRKSAHATVLVLMFVTVHISTKAQVPDSKAAQKAADEAQVAKRAAESIQLLFTPSGLVKNKAFSAEVVTETVQILADGNRIVRRNLTKQYRDRDGRTRQEQTLPIPGQSNPQVTRTIVFIHDPVTKVDYVLDPQTKTTSVVDVPSSLGLSSSPLPNLAAPGKRVVTQSLGTKAIEGLLCAGERTTVTIPAGEIGNEHSIVTVTVTWYSSDIDAVVQSTASDPRFGHTSYALRSVKRGEQPPALFQTPSDYKLQRQLNSGASTPAPEHP